MAPLLRIDQQHLSGLNGDLHETVVAPADGQIGSHAVACHCFAVLHGCKHAGKHVPSVAPGDPDLTADMPGMKLACREDPIVTLQGCPGLASLPALPEWLRKLAGGNAEGSRRGRYLRRVRRRVGSAVVSRSLLRVRPRCGRRRRQLALWWSRSPVLGWHRTHRCPVRVDRWGHCRRLSGVLTVHGQVTRVGHRRPPLVYPWLRYAAIAARTNFVTAEDGRPRVCPLCAAHVAAAAVRPGE
jgi:hypothetical protein